MANSMFYRAAFERRFPIPFLFLEHLGVAQANLTSADDLAMELMIRGSMKNCLGMRKIVKEDIEYVIARLRALEKAPEEKEKKKSTKPGFATAYADWLGGLEPEQICLVMADFNFAEAQRLFAEVDMDDVTRMTTTWVGKAWSDIKLEYECALYGFGGGYKGGAASPDDNEIDVSTNDHTQGKVIDPRSLAMAGF